jgi:hypothetical protein
LLGWIDAAHRAGVIDIGLAPPGDVVRALDFEEWAADSSRPRDAISSTGLRRNNFAGRRSHF